MGKRGGTVCAVKNCLSKAGDKSVKWHKFPKDIDRSKTWIIACDREDLFHKNPDELHRNYKVCGLHFELKMYANPHDFMTRLLPSAVPTIFPQMEASSSGFKRKRTEDECISATKIHKSSDSIMISEEDTHINIAAKNVKKMMSSTICNTITEPVTLSGHPNVKLFVTHGGLLSTIEAVYFGVPVIGIPVYGDQMINMANAVNNGYAIAVPYRDLSEVTLETALEKMLQNSSYAENARKRSKLLHDQPMKPLAKAIYWVEYVLRHKGAPHLQNAGLDLAWYQYSLLDVIVVLTLATILLFIIFYVIIKHLLGRRRKPKQKMY